jgi:phospholipid/cholesterol/gamma-HCH transport system substrate-binding protein
VSNFYKDKTATEIRVGIATLIGLAILIVGYAWLRQAFEARGMQTLRVRFDHAANLEPGDAVSVLGVKSGKVRKMVVDDSGVTAELSVRLGFPLHVGTRFLIKENNMMGDRGVDILPGHETVALDLSQVQTGETQTDLNQLVARLGGVVDRVDTLMAALDGTGRVIDGLGEAADSSKVLLRNAGRFLDRTGTDVRSVLSNISDNSKDLSEIIAENRGAVTRSFSSLDQILIDLRGNFARMDRIVQRADTLTADFSKNESTVGRLLKDRELYDRLLKSSTELDSLLKDVRKNPKRYFKFSVF